jgi:multiple sugar transport system ATP-binding protein
VAKISVQNLVKTFGDVVAVNQVSFDVNDTELLVLLGPSGCGKTTTLRCIAGLEEPDEGDIYIEDRLVNDIHPKDRDVAMVFQSYALYPHMTVFDNMAFPLKMKKTAKDAINTTVKKTADLLQIPHLLDRKPKQLSGGEAQRVALGRAIVRDPKVFLMDEPLSNLDAKLRVHMRSELKRLQKDLGVTTIYVTHDQVEAMTLADQIAVLNNGVLQQIDNSYNIYHNPSNIFIGGFIGSPPMNFIECSLTETEETCFLDGGPCSFPLPKTVSDIVKDKAVNSELILGIRPQDFLVGNESTEDLCVAAEVYVLEPLGSEIIVDLKIGELLLKAEMAQFDGSVGDQVWVGFHPDKLHIFNKKSGTVIY